MATLQVTTPHPVAAPLSRNHGKQKQFQRFGTHSRRIVIVSAGSKKADPAEFPLREAREILKDEKGVGIIAITAAAAVWKLGAAAFGGVAKQMKQDMDKALENKDEKLEAWGKELLSTVTDTAATAGQQLNEASSNFGEAMSELQSSVAAANEKLSKEAEIGAKKWENTVNAVVAPPQLNDPRGGMVAALTEAEKKSQKLVKDVEKVIEGQLSRTEPLESGWLQHKNEE